MPAKKSKAEAAPKLVKTIKLGAPAPKKAPKTVSQITAKAKPAPAKAKSAPAKAKSAPAKAVSAPTKAVSAPTKAVSAPTKAKSAPAKAKSAPAKAKSAPTKAKSAPSKIPISESAPVITQDQIATRAYYIGERRQRMGWPGDPSSDWIEAEAQLIAEAKRRK